jgi:hypothetical protein
MKIILSPIASGYTTTVSVNGLKLTIDGQEIDLAQIPEGGVAEPDDDSPFVGNVTREQVTIKYHYESAKAEPNQSPDINDYKFDVTSGEVPCPIQWKPEPEVEDIEETEAVEETSEVQDV